MSKRNLIDWYVSHWPFQNLETECYKWKYFWLVLLKGCIWSRGGRGHLAQERLGNLPLTCKNFLISPAVSLPGFSPPAGSYKDLPHWPHRTSASVVGAWQRDDLSNNWQKEIIGLGDKCCLPSLLGVFVHLEEAGSSYSGD